MSGSKALIASSSGGAGAKGKKGACRVWRSKGSCPRGSDCPFAHDADVRAPRGEGEQEQTLVAESDFVTSYGKGISSSPTTHTDVEKQVCKFCLKRKCNNGCQCDYRHPQACFTCSNDKSCASAAISAGLHTRLWPVQEATPARPRMGAVLR